MKTSVVLPVLVALAASAALAAEEGGIPWTDDVKKAFAAAKQEGKPVLLDTWAVWCAPCKLMDQTTYKDKTVVEAALRFVPLKVDADVHKTIIQRYQIDAFPTVLFLDGEGREITRLLGFVDAKKLLPALQTVARGYPDYMKMMAGGNDPDAQSTVGRYLLAAGNPDGRRVLATRAQGDPDGRRRPP